MNGGHGTGSPWLSVVIVVHGEQALLQTCTASVLAQASDDVELVAIDDGADGHAPEILDTLAREDARVRVHHLPARLGSGEARQVALDAARGQYVWFIEPAGELPPGSLGHIRERLRASEPDVLLVHHGAADRLGNVRQGPHRALLAALAHNGAFTLDRRPALAAAAVGTRNKVLRREHLIELGARFGAGAHSELPVTWPALLCADRIAAAPESSYVHRRSPRRAPEGSPFDVFANYDAVFASAAAPAKRRVLVAPAMLDHQLSLLGRVREADRSAYFHLVSDSWSRHRTGAEPPPAAAADRVRRVLVERDAYPAYRALERSRAPRRSLRRRRGAAARLQRRVKARASSALMDRHYRSRRTEPIDPGLAVYAAYWYRGYSCNPRAIYEKALELAPHVRGVWVVKADAASRVPDGVEYVVAGTREYYDLIARAKYFINNVNFPNHLVKREGTVHVQTHHGTPLKHMGLDLRHAAMAGRQMDFAALLRRCERWDYSISSNAFSSLIWERVYPTRYESLEVGYPRNDVLATATEHDVAAARRELGIDPGRTAVLYAPTHREYHDGFVPLVDLGRLAEALGPDHVVLARLHYFYDPGPLVRDLHRAGRIRDVASHPSVERLCLAADVLVTDYSSIMFDYATLNRPIVIHAPDWEQYRALRGTYFDLMAEPPGTVARTEPELVDALAGRTAWGEPAARARAAFRERFCSLEDGRASERVVRRVWLESTAEAGGAAPRAR